MTAAHAEAKRNDMAKLNDLSAMITKARKAQGLKSMTVAARIGVTQQHYSRIEHAKVDVSQELMEKLSQVLKTPRLLVVYWENEIIWWERSLQDAELELAKARAKAAKKPKVTKKAKKAA